MAYQLAAHQHLNSTGRYTATWRRRPASYRVRFRVAFDHAQRIDIDKLAAPKGLLIGAAVSAVLWFGIIGAVIRF